MKQFATYDLEEIKFLIKQDKVLITQKAKYNAIEFGFYKKEILKIILSLENSDLYKSMRSNKKSGLWQDVYHKSFQGITFYIKLQINDNAIVISFKEK